MKEKTIYLTFDDGPTFHTPEILKILDNNNVKATFFVVGRNEKIYNEIINKGHSIGLHSFSHDYSYIYSNSYKYFQDLHKLETAIEAQIGYTPKILRFPGGSSNLVSRKYSKGIMTRLTKEVKDRGYKYYDWNCITGDGEKGVTVELEKQNIQPCLNKQTIYLLAHDTKQETVDALDYIIKEFKANNFTFKTITYNTPEYHMRIQN